MPESDYASFMVRLWRTQAGEQGDDWVWMGEIESIQTGRAWQFRDARSLCDLLFRQLDDSSTTNQEENQHATLIPNDPAD